MEETKKKSAIYYMRFLHRNIGFFILGLMVVYSISGFLLIFRDTDFLKSEVVIEKKIEPNIEASKLGEALRNRKLKVDKVENGTFYFQNGSYNSATGDVTYTEKKLPKLLEKFTHLHKSSTEDKAHWFTMVVAFLLFFLAVSSFWMFKPGTKYFKNGMIVVGVGVLATIILLIL